MPAIHKDVSRVCSAIVKASFCAGGFFGFQKAFPGNHMAPFFGAMLASMGENLITNGVGAFNVQYMGAGSGNGKLAVFGGMLLWVLTTQAKLDTSTARAALGAATIANIYVDFDPALKAIMDGLKGARDKVKSM